MPLAFLLHARAGRTHAVHMSDMRISCELNRNVQGSLFTNIAPHTLLISTTQRLRLLLYFPYLPVSNLRLTCPKLLDMSTSEMTLFDHLRTYSSAKTKITANKQTSRQRTDHRKHHVRCRAAASRQQSLQHDIIIITKPVSCSYSPFQRRSQPAYPSVSDTLR